MTTRTTGVFVDGVIRLDDPPALPDHTRVNVTVEPVEDWRERMQAGLSAWLKFEEKHPLHLGGRRFNRDELYERH